MKVSLARDNFNPTLLVADGRREMIEIGLGTLLVVGSGVFIAGMVAALALLLSLVRR
jgi:hypothetical protein